VSHEAWELQREALWEQRMREKAQEQEGGELSSWSAWLEERQGGEDVECYLSEGISSARE